MNVFMSELFPLKVYPYLLPGCPSYLLLCEFEYSFMHPRRFPDKNAESLYNDRIYENRKKSVLMSVKTTHALIHVHIRWWASRTF